MQPLSPLRLDLQNTSSSSAPPTPTQPLNHSITNPFVNQLNSHNPHPSLSEPFSAPKGGSKSFKSYSIRSKTGMNNTPLSKSSNTSPITLPSDSTREVAALSFVVSPQTVTKTVITTTTTTTTEYPPLYLKPSLFNNQLNPSLYPLAQTPTPPSLRKFCFDLNGTPTSFRELDLLEPVIADPVNVSNFSELPRYFIFSSSF